MVACPCVRYSSEAALGLLADALEEAAGLQQLHWQVPEALRTDLIVTKC